MEEKLDVLIEIMNNQLEAQKSTNRILKDILDNIPSGTSTSRIEEILVKIGDEVVNLSL